MSEVDVSDLARHEATIARGLETFVEVGEALAAIRDERLYRETHGTFEDYCRERWGFSRQRAAQMIEAADVVTTMVDTGLPVPTSERQARELARVPEAQRAEVWRETLDRTAGKPTAAAVREVARPARPAPVAEPERSPTTKWSDRSAAEVMADLPEMNGETVVFRAPIDEAFDVEAAIERYPDLDVYRRRPDRVEALASALDGYGETERAARLENLARSAAAVREGRVPSPPPPADDRADRLFEHVNAAMRAAQAITPDEFAALTDAQLRETWRMQFVRATAAMSTYAEALSAPSLRSVQ